MADRRSEDDDIIDAEIVEEKPVKAEPPSEPEPEPVAPPGPTPLDLAAFQVTSRPAASPEPRSSTPPEPQPYAARLERPARQGGGLGIVILLLLVVLVAAIVLRKEITALYNRMVAPTVGIATPPAGAPGRETPAPTASETLVPATPAPAPELPNPEVPTFAPRKVSEPPPAEPWSAPAETVPRETPSAGLAYSIVGRRNVSEEGLQQIELHLIVPRTYTREDLLRMARAVVALERRLGGRHAVRLVCFTDPRRTAPEDVFAEVDWGPGGDFWKAAEAVNKGSDKNEFKVTMKGAP